MKKEWVKIYRTRQFYEAKVLEAKLKEYGIETHILNKQDSSYLILLPGDVELYCLQEDAEQAMKLVKNELKIKPKK